MANDDFLCNDERLLAMLHQPTDAVEHEAMLAHVEQCAACQTRLEQLAASVEEWKRAGDALAAGMSGGDDEPARRADRLRAWRWLERRTAWTESLAQQWLAPPAHPEMLGRLGRYEVERLIGAGGMGVVFKAFDTELNRVVAIKVLAPPLSVNGPARRRFAREARAAAAVVHDHVVPIHNVETEHEPPFLVMQYVAGESLQARLDREGALELCEILRIGRQVAAGLSAAHAQGLVHRDIKPSNILLEPSIERALITDFGLARAADDASITNTGFHPGTPQYMSPEQAAGESVDARSDLFSLGSVLYAMCTGRPPFRAETTLGVLRRIADSQPRQIRELNPSIPDWLERVVMQLLSKDASQRFATASDVAALLEHCLAHVQQPTVHALPESLSAPITRNSRRRPNWLALSLLLVIVCVGGGAVRVVVGLLPRTTGALAQFEPPQSDDSPPAAPAIVKTIHGTGLASRLASSADGRRIAAASDQGSGMELRVVDVETSETIFAVMLEKAGQLEQMQDAVTALEFSSNGKRLAVGTLLGEVSVLDAETGKVWRVLEDRSFTPNDPAFEKTPLVLKNRKRALGGVRGLAFSPDGNQLAVGGDSFQDAAQLWSERELPPRRVAPGRLKVWDFRDNTVAHCLGHSVVTDVAFAADGRFLASAGRWDDERQAGGGVILWKPDSFEPFHRLPHDSRDLCMGVRFLPGNTRTVDARIVSIASRNYQAADSAASVVRLTNVVTGQIEWEQVVPTGCLVGGGTFDHAIGVQSTDWSFRLLNSATGKETLAFRPSSAPLQARPLDSNWLLVPQRHWLAIVPPCHDPAEGRLEIWSLDAAAVVSTSPQQAASPPDRSVQARSAAPSTQATPRETLRRLVRGGKIESKSLDAMVAEVARHAADDAEFARSVLVEFRQSCNGGDQTSSSRRELLRVLVMLFEIWDVDPPLPPPAPLHADNSPAPKQPQQEQIKAELLACVMERAYSSSSSEIATFTLAVRQSRHRDAKKFLLDVLRHDATVGDPYTPPAEPAVRVWKEPAGASWDEAQFIAAVGLAEMGAAEAVDWLLEQAHPNDFGIDRSLWQYRHVDDRQGSRRESSRLSLCDLFHLAADKSDAQLADWWRDRSAQFGGGRVQLKLGTPPAFVDAQRASQVHSTPPNEGATTPRPSPSQAALRSIDTVSPERMEASIDRILAESRELPASERAELSFDLMMFAHEWLGREQARQPGFDGTLFERVKHQCAMAGLEHATEIPAGRALRLLEFATSSQLTFNADDDPDWPAARRLKATLWLMQVERVRNGIDPNWDESDVPQLNNSEIIVLHDPAMRAEQERRLAAERKKAETYREQLTARRLLAEVAPRMEEHLVRLYARRPLNVEQLDVLLKEYCRDASQRERIAQTVRLLNAILPQGTRLKYGWPDGLADAGPDGVPRLMEAVRDPTYPSFIRYDGAWALGLIGDARALPVLQEIADDDATPTKYQDIAREFVRAMEEKRAADK
ncbi:MAG: serine/threonine-protein kinase [Pirellulales bacterium]